MAKSTPVATSSAIRILFAYDNAAFARRAMRILQEWDRAAVVGSAASGDEMVTRARELQPDVVLVDLAIPDLAGLHMVTRLRTTLPQAGIVALTALGLDSQSWAVEAAGADTLVSKTAIRTDLLPAIRRVVESRTDVQASSAMQGGTA